MKKLQEGFQLDVDEDEDVSYSLSEDDEEDDDAPPKPKKKLPDNIDDMDLDDLEDLDLLDPFGDDPVPKKPKDVRHFGCQSVIAYLWDFQDLSQPSVPFVLSAFKIKSARE